MQDNVTRIWHASTSVAVWHSVSLAHIFPCYTRHVIGLVDTFLLDEFDWLIVFRHQWWGSFAWLFRSKIGQNFFLSFFVVLDQFLSDFDRVKSNVSLRLSTLTYQQEIFDRTTPLSTCPHIIFIRTAKDNWARVYSFEFSENISVLSTFQY